MSKPVEGNLSRIQELVDELASSLGRSVAVDNPSFELVCASAQIGVIDERRIAAIIDRSPPLEPVPWMLSQGIQTSHKPVRLPANEQYGMLPRVCFPIRHDGLLLGYLWLFDEPTVTDDDVEEALQTVSELALILQGEDEELQRRAEEVRSLTVRAISRASADDAVQRAVALGYLPQDGQLAAHLIRIRHPGVDVRPLPALGAKNPQLELSRPRPGRPYLVHYGLERLIVISRSRSLTESTTTLRSVGRLLAAGGILMASTGSSAADSAYELETAMERADFAAELSALLGKGPEPLHWHDTGSWRLLKGRALNEATVAELSEDAVQLLKKGTPEQWRTLLAYFDAGRSVGATSQNLSIHRATLHYRLERIREIIDPEALNDGWRAASLHVALKLHHALQTTTETPTRLPEHRSISP